MRTSFSPEMKQAAVARVNNGELLALVAAAYGVSKVTIWKWVHRTRPFDLTNTAEIQQAVDLYVSGKSLSEVAQEMGRSVTCVRGWLKKQPKSILRPHGWKKRLPLDWVPKPTPNSESVTLAASMSNTPLVVTSTPVLVTPPPPTPLPVYESSSIRAPTKQELMQGKAGGYRTVLAHHNCI